MIHKHLTLLSVIFLASCQHAENPANDIMPPLHKEPIIVPLNLKEGYKVNQFTRDSIAYLNNYLGDTIKTGVPIKIQSVSTFPFQTAPPLKIKTDPGKEIQFRSEILPVPENLIQHRPDVSVLASYAPYENTPSKILLNNYGDSIMTSTPAMIPETYQTFVPSAPVPAQMMRMRDRTTYDIQYLSLEQGLPSSVVKGILEDHNGNIWLGTDKGVTWFDGAYFRHYPSAEMPRLIFTNSILEDTKGNLWFCTMDGIVCLNEKGYFWISEQQGQLYNNGITSILEDSKGSIWFGTWNGMVLRYEPSIQGDTGRLTHFLLKDDPQTGMVTGIIEDQYGHLWFGTTRDGLFQFDGKRFLQFTKENGLPGNGVWALCSDRKGQFWVGTAFGACLYKPGVNGSIGVFTHLTVKEGLIHNNVKSICVASDHSVWFGTWGGGVNCLKEIQQNGVSRQVLLQYAEKEGLSSRLIHTVYEDRNQNIWVNTAGGGTNIIRHGSFEHISDVEDISNLIIRSVYEDRDHNIWIGTEGAGITRISNQTDISTSKLKYFTSTNDFIIRWTCDITEDQTGQLWFGSTEGMMKMISPKDSDQLAFHHFSGEQGFTDAFVMCITPDSKGNLWFGTFGGGLIQARLSQTGEIEEFIHFTEDQGLAANYILDVIEDDKGNLWVETDINGLFYLELAPDRKSGTMTVYAEREGLLSQRLSCMYMDQKRDLWIGTESNGLCKLVLSAPNGEAKCIGFTKAQGLADEAVKEIIPFPGNAPDRPFWVTTKNGLSLVQPHAIHDLETILFTFGRNEGLKHTGFTYRNGVVDHRQQLWMGTERGLQVLNLNDFNYSTEIPKPYIRQIQFNEKQTNFHKLPDSLRRDISYVKTDLFENLPIEPIFSYKNNHLTFYFSAPDWSAPYKLKYGYKIRELNEDWSMPSAETKAEYRNLPSGRFTFMVRAIGESQIWSEPFEYTFTIRPPWWYSWWAIVMYSCFGGFVLYSTYRFQLNRKLEIAEKQRLVELDQIKNRLYTNITHEFRTPLTLIHGPVTQALSKNTVLEQKDIQSIHRQSERLQQLINQMLQLQKLEAGMLKPHFAYGEIIQVLRYLFGSFETWAKDKNISMLFSSSLQEVYMDFDQEKLTQIISNLVSNAIKHTPRGGKVAMVINPSSSADFLLINVSDTGTGISEEDLPYIFDRFYQSKRASSGGTGIGLALVKNLTDLLGGQISVESKLDSGSTFKLSLPITKRTHKPSEAVPATDVNIHEAHDEEINFITPQHIIPGKPIVLIVEDHPEVLQYVASCLADEYTILSAKDGDEGLRLAYERVPDLIISDVMMPGKDGFELCNILKRDIQTSHIPIILLTGRGDHEAMMEGIGQGADAYIIKPFDPEELLLRVKKLLELRTSLSEYYRKYATTENPETVQQSSPKENEFLQKVRAFVEEHLNDSRFNMDMLCHQMAMSHPQLHRKITALTGESTGKFVRSVRLTKAMELLRHSDLTISEIAYETGFSEPGYFTKVFSKEFNTTPTEYRSGMSG